MAIGVGLGLGADHRVTTVVASILIMSILAGRYYFTKPRRGHNLFLNVDVPGGADNGTLERVTDLLKRNTQMVDVRRLDFQGGSLQATFYIDAKDDEELITTMNELKASLPGASITFVDQSNTLGA